MRGLTDDAPSGEDWIVVRRWEEFQHYKDRDPTWIKNYVRLLHDPNYFGLSLSARGLLHVIWLAFAATSGQLRVSAVGHLARTRGGLGLQLASLNHAGFIDFSASAPLAPKKEEEKEIETPQTPLPDEDPNRLAITRAFDFAADWNGGSSEAFHEGLDSLERELHVRIGSIERDRLWDVALKRERRRS